LRKELPAQGQRYFAFNFGAARPFHVGERFPGHPKVEVFNLFNNKNNINTISGSGTPLFDFDGFIRQGVGIHVKRNCQYAAVLTGAASHEYNSAKRALSAPSCFSE